MFKKGTHNLVGSTFYYIEIIEYYFFVISLKFGRTQGHAPTIKLFYLLLNAFSNNTTEPYITAATIASIITPVITKSNWNT